ncbi:hypothetical protein SAMN06297387_103219 [Streptomyces zhaozhouensis]|uniref:Uncharacterized protein n=1 Tax=Streptomyces zhaozhouensis TaxID=1300267 RepID=A0A286DSA9_9ACTN|nr:hypothetical protein [Streptomyces zhaozhouensis]SOD61540.1 hypothetical protein SAMN06297387_103219 [Streptomyces zhaozhouensis]
MSDAAQPTAAEVRAASEALKEALDRHLAAIERRAAATDAEVEAADADVFAAFNEMAAAGEVYDELLYEVYDEVTPFEVPASDGAAYDGPEDPEVISVFMRRDYLVSEPRRLLGQAERIAELDAEGVESEGGSAEPAAGRSVKAALGVLFGEFDPDEIASRHEEFGLAEGDATLWVTAQEEPAEPGEWLAAPFDAVDAERVICRFDISDAFDDEALDAVDEVPRWLGG